MIRAVVDAGVFVSALLGRRGTHPDRVVRSWIRDEKLIVSPALLEELGDVLRRPKFAGRISGQQVDELLTRIERHAVIVADVKPAPKAVRDPGDDYLVALARSAQIDVLVSGDGDLLEAELPDVRVWPPRRFVERLDELYTAALAEQAEQLRRVRRLWGPVFGVLGGLGHRPKLTLTGLVAYGTDGAAVVVAARDQPFPEFPLDAPLTVTLRTSGGQVVEQREVHTEHHEDVLHVVLELAARLPLGQVEPGRFITHAVPSTLAEQLLLGGAYAQYHHVLTALAERGLHAYIEDGRVYADLGPELLLDVSSGDAPLPVFAEDDDDWVVFLTTPGGFVAELTVPRMVEPHDGALVPAEAVEQAVTDVLRGRPILFEFHDPELGRLEPLWLRGARRTDRETQGGEFRGLRP